MAVELNHTIVAARDAEASARWWSEVLGLGPAEHWRPFWHISTANNVNLDFETVEDQGSIQPRHYAFLLSDEEFDEVLGRLEDRAIDYFADPFARRKGEINHDDGGRGLYFADPDGHWLEIITRPYTRES